MGRKRWGCAALALAGLGLGVGGVVGSVFVLRTPWGNSMLEFQLEKLVSGLMVEGRFVVDGLNTNLTTDLSLDGLRLEDGAGKTLFGLGPTQVRFNVASLLTGPLTIHHLHLTGLELVLDSKDGRFEIAHLFGPPSDTPSTEPFSLPIDLDVRNLFLEGGSFRLDGSVALAGATGTASVRTEGPRFHIDDLALCTDLLAPGPVPLCAEGPLLWDGSLLSTSGLALEAPGSALALSGSLGESFDLDVLAGNLDLRAIDPITKRAGLQGHLAGDLKITGVASDLQVAGRLSGAQGIDGSALLDLTIRTGPPFTFGGKVDLFGLDVKDVYAGVPQSVVVDGAATLDGEGIDYPDDFRLGLTYQGKVAIDGELQLREVDVVGEIEEGVLTLTKGAFDGIAGPLQATGTLDLVEGPMAIRVAGPLSPAQLAELGVEGLGGIGRVDALVTGDLKADTQRFRIDGDVGFQPFIYGDDVRFERLKAGVKGWYEDGGFQFGVDLAAAGGNTYGVTLETVGSTDLVARGSSGRTFVDGQLAIGAIAYPSAGRFESASVDLSVVVPEGGGPKVEAIASLGAFDLQTFVGTGGRVGVVLDPQNVVFDVDLVDGDRTFLRTLGTFDLATQSVTADRLDISPTPRLAWTSEGLQRLRISETGVTDTSLHLRGLHGDLAVVGTLATEGAVDGGVVLNGLQLDALAELFPEQLEGLSGVLSLDARVQGDAHDPLVMGAVDLDGLWLDGVTRWLDVDGVFDGNGDHLRVDVLVGSAGAALGTLVGELPVSLDLAKPALLPQRPVDASFALAPGPMERFEHVTVEDLGLPVGEIGGQLTATGLLRDPDFRLAGIAQTAVGGWVEPGRVEFDVRRNGSDLKTWVVAREGLDERARLEGGGVTRMQEVFANLLEGAPAPDTGDLRLWMDDVGLAVVLADLPASSVTRLAELNVPLAGRFSGAFRASGDPYKPTLNGELEWFDGAVGDVLVQEGIVQVKPSKNGLELDAQLGFEEGHLKMNGYLPVAVDLREGAASWLAGELDLVLDSEQIPLGLLRVIDGVQDPVGKLSVDGTVKGTFERPDISVDVLLAEAGLTYEPLGLRFSNMAAEAEGRGGRMKLSRFVARTEPIHTIGLLEEKGSLIRLTGAANLSSGALEQVSARAVLEDAWVMGTYDIGVRAAGDVRLSGAWPALNLDGDLDLVQGRFVYRGDEAVAASPLQPSDGLTIHRETGRFATEVVDTTPIYSEFDIDLKVDLKRNLEVVATVPFFDDFGQLTAALTQARVNTRVGGNVEVALNPDASFRLGGQVEIADGTVQVVRTKFSLEDGTVQLSPDDIGESQLSLSANSNVQGTSIDLRITGTIDDPEIAMTSEGYDQTQVLAMLLTGRSVDSMGGEDGKAAADAALAAAALITSTVFSGSSAGAISVEADGSVRVGAPFAQNVFSELILRPFADSDENGVAFSLEWALVRKLLLQAGAGNRFQWTDISWETRF